jgi:hypothetical protein
MNSRRLVTIARGWRTQRSEGLCPHDPFLLHAYREDRTRRAAPASPARRALGVLVALGGLALPLAAASAAPEPYVARPVRFASPPAIDGTLDDPIWRTATRLDGFRQLEPQEGAPASEATEVYLGYDAHNLYIGARCHDSEPKRAVATILTRDGDLSYEDTLQIVVDTFDKGQNGFLFATNPLGVEVDALVRNEGEEVNLDWDGIWRCATHRGEDGWTAEIVIPFRTLRFPAGGEQVWRFNVERYLPRRQEKSYWKPVSRTYGFYARYKTSQFGELRGLEGIEPGGRYQLKPFAVAGDRNQPTHRGGGVDGGADLKVNLTSDLVADATLRTDFGETEADEQQVNLTRYSLYLPEKREFFLEGASLFYFGERPEPYHAAEDILFFSRRIGLTPDGLQEVPVLGGAKLTGHAGGYSIGALGMATQRESFGGIDGQPPESVPRTTYSALRLKRDYAGGSFGILGLASEGAGDHNEVGGADWDVKLGDNLRTGGYVARSRTTGANALPGSPWAGSSDLFYDSKNARFRLAYTQIGDAFDDELGFLTRTGVRKYRADLNRIVWPQGTIFRQAWFTYDLDYVTDLAGRLVSRVNNLQANAFFQNSSGLAFKWYDDLEVLTRPFAIHPGIVIPPGAYRFDHSFFGFQTDYGRRFGGAAQISGGQYFDGRFLQVLYGITYHPLPGLLIQPELQTTRVSLREGRFTTNLLLGQVDYGITPDLAVRLWVQSSRGQSLRTQLVLHWIYRPGASLYLVYQDLRKYTDIFDPQQPVAGVPGRQLLTKVVYVLF